MKKPGTIATLTFHEALSYGAILQAYALQAALLKEGVDTTVLNYRCRAIWERYYSFPHGVKPALGRLLRFPWYGCKVKKFESFRNSMLIQSELVTRHEIGAVADSYLKIVVGSDQVWNPDLTDNDDTFFLDFTNDSEKKISYAASIGTERWDQGKERRLLSLVKGFQTVTVREKTASEYLRSSGDIESTVVCDPTFLLNRDDWLGIAAPINADPGYVLVYCLGKHFEDCLLWARRVAQDSDLQIVVIHSGWKHIKGVLNVRDAGPTEFLGWLANASYVITNSYHGICLSMNLGKEFYWVRGEEDLRKKSSRIIDLLDMHGLRNREVTSDSELLPNYRNDALAKSIDVFRKDSLDKLLRALKS